MRGNEKKHLVTHEQICRLIEEFLYKKADAQSIGNREAFNDLYKIEVPGDARVLTRQQYMADFLALGQDKGVVELLNERFGEEK